MKTGTKNLFICGPNRSGTSLLRKLLNENEFINLNDIELNFFYIIKNYNSKRKLKERLKANKKFMDWVSDQDFLFDVINKNYPNKFAIYNKLLKKKLFLNNKILFYGEKTTFLEFKFIKYLNYYGRKLCFIHIIRDPLKTYESQIYYKGEKRKINILRWSIKWLLSFVLSKYFSIRYKNLFISIKFSDLIHKKKYTESKINNFLNTKNLKFDEKIYKSKINSSFAFDNNVYKSDERLNRFLIKCTLVPIYKIFI
mgnify:CR=1 FL=1